MADLPPHFRAAADAVRSAIDAGAALIALDGRKMVGKTTLGRYLSYELGIPLISGDWFLDHSKEGELAYYYDDIKRIFDNRFTPHIRQPTIIESINVLQVLDRIGHRADFHVYIFNQAERDETGRYEAEITGYEAKYTPRKLANVSFEHPMPLDAEL